MPNITNIDTITKVIEAMMQFESALADFYKQCADAWAEDQGFWRNLANAELQHENNLRKMREIIINKQNSFNLGRSFNTIALNTAITGIHDNIKRLMGGFLSREKVLFIARDIEQSVLEANYSEIVNTSDIECQTLMKDILSQTYDHKMAIQNKINLLKS